MLSNESLNIFYPSKLYEDAKKLHDRQVGVWNTKNIELEKNFKSVFVSFQKN